MREGIAMPRHTSIDLDRRALLDSWCPQPHLKNGSAYRQNRPTLRGLNFVSTVACGPIRESSSPFRCTYVEAHCVFTASPAAGMLGGAVVLVSHSTSLPPRRLPSTWSRAANGENSRSAVEGRRLGACRRTT